MRFFKENWYKLMTGTAMLIFACGFFIYAVSPSYANYTKQETPSKSDYALVPLNKDGSINIKLSEEQLNEIKPPATQNVQIVGYDKYGSFSKAKVGNGQLIVFNNSNPVRGY